MQTMEQTKNTPKSYCYDIFIRNTLGRYLPECLQEVTELKPADPIEYIFNWLYKVYDSQMYYKAKVNYLREMYQLDEILRKEKQEHEARIKPFMQAMEVERWNYFVSLHAELVALEEVMGHVDAEVDEGTQLRFLEVQLLIKEEEGLVKDPEMAPLPAKSTSDKVAEEEPEPVKSKTSIPAFVRNSPEVLAERKSIVMMEEMQALEESASERLERHRLPRVRRLVRSSRRPLNQGRLDVAGLSTVQQAPAADTINESAASDLTLDADSDKCLCSSQSNDSKADDLKQKTKHTEICQVATTNFFRYVLDESGSFIMDSLRSSPASSDSDTDQHDRPEVYESKQQIDAVSATKRSLDVAMSYSDGEDYEIPACEIDVKSSDDSLSTSSRTPKYSTSKCPQLPEIIPQGRHTKENAVTSLPDGNTEAFTKTSHRTVLGLHRNTALSQNENLGMEYQSDVLEVSEETDICRIHRKDDCGGFHLPPVRIHGNTSRVVSADEDGEVSERQNEGVSGRSASSDEVVHLPAIAAGSRTTGTIVMTNSGHIAFVNKRLGVIAPNSLKIRSVHPIDKPEIWARKNFQSESFYDHELYGETDRALADSEDDERWHSSISRMNVDEFMEAPYRRWKKPKKDDTY